MLKGKHFGHAVDIGGGYGRLSTVLSYHADKVTLAEPSQQQLDIAADYLKDFPLIERALMQADNLAFPDKSIDLVAMIRVMHHLPDPAPEFTEIARVLKKDGYLLLEVANYANFKNRVRHALKGQKLPLSPVDIRSEANRRKDEIAFVNHNPKTVAKQLAASGLKVEKILSVSNLRSPRLKKIMPRGAMLAFEDLMQPTLAKMTFGPSTFMLVKKV
jgi:ubiquinone/menaquinone biosynthesis C-methylase UbiE